MADELITPRTLKGFRDFLPEAMLAREHLIDTAKAVYRSYGFSPIDTPALEYTEILLGKGGAETDKQLYRFEDAGGRDVALRFDLTVPLARFMAQHVGKTGTPFKRYHVGSVWRGENTQRGRYREFLQCDFDTIGTASLLADVETALVIHDLFRALGFERFTIHVSNRKVLSGLLEQLGLLAQSSAVMRAIDKLAKIGRQGLAAELERACGASGAEAAEILRFVTLRGDNRDVVTSLADLVTGSETGRQGVAELNELLDGVEAAGIDMGRIRIDVSIARGLDYYTGTVYETFLDDLRDIGSCCSGGRYDDLASVYTKQRLPGVGASLGVDRLLAAIQELGLVESRTGTADVLVTLFDADGTHRAVELAAELRDGGVSTELYPETRKLSAQLRYADRRGHRLAIIVGPAEVEAGTAQIKDLASGHSVEVPRAEVTARCRTLLAG